MISQPILPLPTWDRVREVLTYVPETGEFFRRVDLPGHKKKAGDPVGCPNRGYVQLAIDGRKLKAHRVAFFWMTGKWPENDIDHINGIKNDNRWVNLRDVPRLFNNHNKWVATVRSPTGFMGVTKARNSIPERAWMASITENGLNRIIGYFSTVEAAHEAFMNAKRQYHQGFAK